MNNIPIYKTEDFGFYREFPIDEYALRPSVYCIAFDEEGNIPTLYYPTRGNPFIIPGGGVEPGETSEEAAKRELREEVGCDIDSLEPLGTFDAFSNESKINFRAIIYKAKVVGKHKPQPAKGYEQESKVLWKSLAEVVAFLEANTPESRGGHEGCDDRPVILLQILKDQEMI